MKSKPLLSTLTLLAFIPMFFLGCQNNTPANTGATATATPEKATGPDMVTIADLLTRTDLNDKARKAFEGSEKRGQHEMAKSAAEEIVAKSYRKNEVRVKPKTGDRTQPTSLPTLSRNDSPTAVVDIETTPLSNDQLIDVGSSYYEMGVDHFEKRFIYGLPDDVRGDAAAWMRSVFREIHMSDNDDQWHSIHQQAAIIATRAKSLEDEPMFCFCRATAAALAIGEDAAVDYFDKAMINFRRSDYPTRMPICCYHFDKTFTPSTESRHFNYNVMNVAFFHWIENDFRAVGHEQRFALDPFKSFFDLMLIRGDKVATEAFIASVKNSEQLTPWTKAMLLSELNYKIGFYRAGYNYSNNASEEQISIFKKYCKIAEKHAIEAYKLRPEYYESVATLLTLAKFGYAEEDEDYWFEKAIEYEPDRLNVYRQQVDRLYPSNGGSTDKMLDFLLQRSKASDSLTLAFLLPREIFRCRGTGEFDADQWQELIASPRASEATLAALDKIIDSGQSVSVVNKIYSPEYYLTVKAIFAYQAKKFDIAEATFDQLGDQFSKEGLRCFSIDHSSYARLRSSVYAFTSEYQAEAFELEKLWGNTYETRHKNADRILELTDGLADWVNTHSGGLYFKHARNILLGELNFEDQTLPLKFDESFTVWQSGDFSQINFIDADSVEIDNRRGASRFHLNLAYWLPDAKTFECDFRFTEHDLAGSHQSATSQPIQKDKRGVFRPSVGVGTIGNSHLMIGLTTATNKRTRNARKLAYNGILTISPNYSSRDIVSYDVILKPEGNRLRIAVCEGYTEIFFDDNYVCRFSGPMFHPANQITFEQPKSARGRGTVMISNPSIRKWTNKGPDLVTRDPQALITYFEKAVKEEPDDAWQKFWLGQAKHFADDYQGALRQYIEAIEGGVSPRIAGYYLGDAYDRLGNREKAVEWYRRSVDPTVEQYPSPRGIINRSTPEQWAAFRLRWILATKTKLSEKELAELDGIRMNLKLTGLEDQLSYLAVDMAKGRLTKNYADALKGVERYIKSENRKRRTGDLRELLQPVLDAFAEGKPYVRPKSQRPLYLTFDDENRFFY